MEGNSRRDVWLGPQGADDFPQKVRLCQEVFNCDWLTLFEIDQTDYRRGVLYLEVKDELAAELNKDND